MHLDAEIVPFAVQNIVSETLNRYTRSVVLRENRYRLAAIFNTSDQIDLSELMEQCRHNVEQYSKRPSPSESARLPADPKKSGYPIPMRIKRYPIVLQ